MRHLVPLLTLTVGCLPPPQEAEFGEPDLLGPLEPENLAPVPEGDAAQPYPHELAMVSGYEEEEDRYWAHARGYLRSPSADVWAALRTTEVVVDRRSVDAWEVEDNPEPDFDFSFLIHNTVNDVFTVQYDLVWVHELQDGQIDNPSQVVAQWGKTDGTPFISVLEGSVVLKRLDANVTEIELIERMVAAQRDEETLELYLGDLYASLLAELNGDPLPTYE